MSPKVFITADLTLPIPPENHNWVIQNLVKIKKSKMKYSINVSLLNIDNIIVLVHEEKWDREISLLNDFLAVISDEVTRKLDDYINFQSIDWEENNPLLKRNTTEVTLVNQNQSSIQSVWS